MPDFLEDHPIICLIAFITLCDAVVDIVKTLCSGGAKPWDILGVTSAVLAIFLAMYFEHRMWVKGGRMPRETYDQGGFSDGGWDVVHAGHGEWVVVQNTASCGRWATEDDARRMARVYNAGR